MKYCGSNGEESSLEAGEVCEVEKHKVCAETQSVCRLVLSFSGEGEVG